LVPSGFTARNTRSVTPDVFRLSLETGHVVGYVIPTLLLWVYDPTDPVPLVPCSQCWKPRSQMSRSGSAAHTAMVWIQPDPTDSRLPRIACEMDYETGLWTLAARTVPGLPILSPSPCAPLATTVRYTMISCLSSPSPLIS